VYHSGVRTSVLTLASVLVLALACADEPERVESAPRSSSVDSPSPSAPVAAAPVDEPSAPELEPALAVAPDPEPDPASAEPTLSEPAPEPSDPLAPILPSAPEPGSPEADAELAELLEESTLTQEEFDAAFRDSKPKIAGDQFVFGPGDRTRKRPVITIGGPKIENSKLAASEISALAKAHLRGFEGCLAVALTEAPSTKGSVTLRVRFDAKGEAESATIEGGAALGEPLRECLAAVADNWSLAGAAGATVAVALTLASE